MAFRPPMGKDTLKELRLWQLKSPETTPVRIQTRIPDPDPDPDPDPVGTFDPSRTFHKNVFFPAFTATWCAPCYASFKVPMAEFLEDAGHADHVVQMNMQYGDDIDDSGLAEELAVEVEANLNFTVRTIPTVLADFRVDVGDIQEAWDECMSYPAVTVIKAETSYSDGTARIEVSLGAKEEGNYRLVAAIVEDNVVAYQNGHGAGYNHTNVLRYISDRRVLGPRNIGMSAGEEVSQSYSFTIDESICNADNLAAVVYSLRYENGVLVADNAVKVALGDSIDYRYDD